MIAGMKPSVTLSLVPEVRGGPFIFWDVLKEACREAANLNFHGIEIFPPGPEALHELKLSWTLKEYHLELAALGTGAGWAKHKLSLSSADEDVRARAREFVKGIVDVAGDLNSQVIVGSMQGQAEGPLTREEAIKNLGDSLEHLASHASARGVTLLFEFLNRYETNLFNRVGDVLPFVKELGQPGLKVLADLFHMNIEETSIPEAIRELGPMLGHVHFVDSNRRAAGFGHIDFPPIMKALREIGYTGYLSAEGFAWPDSTTAAAQTMKAFHELAG